MARFALIVILFGLSASACAPARAKAVGRVGMVMAIAGVTGIIASATVGQYTDHSTEMMVGASAVSAGGILLYASHELSGPEVIYKQETRQQRHTRWARVLTEHAAGAARSGNCVPVRKFEPRVRVYDSAYHDFVFMRDPEILRCLEPVPAIVDDVPPQEIPSEP